MTKLFLPIHEMSIISASSSSALDIFHCAVVQPFSVPMFCILWSSTASFIFSFSLCGLQGLAAICGLELFVCITQLQMPCAVQIPTLIHSRLAHLCLLPWLESHFAFRFCFFFISHHLSSQSASSFFNFHSHGCILSFPLLLTFLFYFHTWISPNHYFVYKLYFASS